MYPNATGLNRAQRDDPNWRDIGLMRGIRTALPGGTSWGRCV